MPLAEKSKSFVEKLVEHSPLVLGDEQPVEGLADCD
jgi:hypothetical protein